MKISHSYSQAAAASPPRCMPRWMVKLFLIMSLLASILVLPARAADSLETEFARAELLSAVEATGNLSEIQLGLQVTLRPGWKIYWRSPGDAGLPTQLSIQEAASSKLKLTIAYPLPERFSLFGLDTYGYGEKVIFPVRVTGHSPGQPLDLRADLNALICSDICVPFNGPLAIRLPAGAVRPSDHAREIARAAALVPRETSDLGISIKSATYDHQLNSLYVQFKNMDISIDDIFIETEQRGLSFARPALIKDGLYKISVSGAVEDISLEQQTMRLTVQSEDLFGEQTVTIEPVSKQTAKISTLALILLLALAGGVILNIMPCVLPVLSLKLTSIISMRTSQPQIIRLRLLTGAVGILSSFALLTGGLVLLKLTGARIGWGIQFQNLYFLTAMALFLGIFTLILLNKIQLPTPQLSTGTQGSQFSSDFLSGFVATLLATPCSAPLVGTAVSFALSADYAVLTLILMTMGVGLALPWLMLAIAPHLVLMLPKPGVWLNYVRPVLASGLLLTILWLLWLISLASSALFAGGIAAGLIFIWLVSAFGAGRFVWPGSIGIAVIFVLLAGWIGIPAMPADRQNELTVEDGVWQPFSLELLTDLRNQKQAVFVDITADWCITCQVNKQLVLERKPVLQSFAKANVTLLRADWTRPNDMIADYLLNYDRFGIPFNSLYLPNMAEPVIFSEILAAEKIINLLENRLR